MVSIGTKIRALVPLFPSCPTLARTPMMSKRTPFRSTVAPTAGRPGNTFFSSSQPTTATRRWSTLSWSLTSGYSLHATPCGADRFALYVAPADGRRRRVAVVGRAGQALWTTSPNSTSFRDIHGTPTRLPAKSCSRPCNRVRVDGRSFVIVKRFHSFSMRSRQWSRQSRTPWRGSERGGRSNGGPTVRRHSTDIRPSTRELADLDNPMRTPTGSEQGEGAVFEPDQPGGRRDLLLLPRPRTLPTSASCSHP